MNPNRLDELARLIGSGQSRRRVLKTFAAGALGMVAASLGLSEAGAEKRRPVGQSCTTKADCSSNSCVDNVCQCRALRDCPAHPECQTYACSAGACVLEDGDHNEPCDSGNACTFGDACQQGVCTPGKLKDCPPRTDKHCQHLNTCNPDTGECEAPPMPNGTSCPGSDFCHPEGICQDGVCTPGPLRECSLPHATGVCRNRGCRIASCDPGYITCIDREHEGCQTHAAADLHNCGSCHNWCPSRPEPYNECLGEAICTDGVCGFVPKLSGTLCRGDLNSRCDGAGVCVLTQPKITTDRAANCAARVHLTNFPPIQSFVVNLYSLYSEIGYELSGSATVVTDAQGAATVVVTIKKGNTEKDLLFYYVQVTGGSLTVRTINLLPICFY